MQVDNSTITVTIAQPPVNGVTKSHSYLFSNECSITLCSFTELLQARKQEAPHLPFLIAKVKDVQGGTHFYDGGVLYTHLKQHFTNPFTNLDCKNVRFYRVLESTGSVLAADEIECWASTEDRDTRLTKSSVACFLPENVEYRIAYVMQCLFSDRVAEGMYWAKVCAQDSNKGVDADLFSAAARAVSTMSNDTKTAKKLLKKAIAASPNSVAALEHLGELYFQDKPLKAKSCFEKTLLQNPDNVVALVRLGALLQQSRNSARAKSLTLRAIDSRVIMDSQLFELAKETLKQASIPRSCVQKIYDIFSGFIN
jgi:tetratricopeptide (TPR) repeat protein